VLPPPVQTLVATSIFAKGEKANRFRSQKSPAQQGWLFLRAKGRGANGGKLRYFAKKKVGKPPGM
jgi:hypothetical protein